MRELRFKNWMCSGRRLRLGSEMRSKIYFSVISFFTGYFFHSLVSHQNANKTEIYTKESSSNIGNYDSTDPFLVILIFSSVNNFNMRQAIRETWLSDISNDKDIKHYFIISEGGSGVDQKSLIEQEQKKNGDLIIFQNLEDSFYLLTQKLVASFGWLANVEVLQGEGDSKTQKTFQNFQYVLKCDDDSFVRIQEVLRELKSIHSGDSGENLYWGFFDGRAKAKKSGKYREEEWNICDNYLPYALGGGYVLARPLISFVAKNERFLKKYRNEDVSVGAWLSSYSGINRLHDPRFDTEYLSRGCQQTYLITHKQSETEMRSLYGNLKSTGKLCRREYKTRMSYVYNWQVPPSKCCPRVNPKIP